MTDCPQTLMEAVRYFADLDVCNEYMKRIKWGGNAIVCPACGAKGERIGELKEAGESAEYVDVIATAGQMRDLGLEVIYGKDRSKWPE